MSAFGFQEKKHCCSENVVCQVRETSKVGAFPRGSFRAVFMSQFEIFLTG